MKMPVSEEQWVLRLYGFGMSIADIARHLKITQRAVRGHVEAAGGESAFKKRGQDAAETLENVVAFITDDWKIVAGRRRRALALVMPIEKRPSSVVAIAVPDGCPNAHLADRLGDTDLDPRTFNVLHEANIHYIWQLVEHTEGALLRQVKGFGRKQLNAVKGLLESLDGLTLNMRVKHMFDPQYTPLT
jgi:hypothetical protein